MIDQLEKEARESSQEKGKVGKDRELIMPKAKPFTAQAYGLAAVMLGSMAFVPVYGSVPLAISPLVKVVVNSSCAQEKKNKPPKLKTLNPLAASWPSPRATQRGHSYTSRWWLPDPTACQPLACVCPFNSKSRHTGGNCFCPTCIDQLAFAFACRAFRHEHASLSISRNLTAWRFGQRPP